VKEKRNTVLKIKRRKANWIGTSYVGAAYVIERKKKVSERGGRKPNLLQDTLRK
jgi:hypothetical protein